MTADGAADADEPQMCMQMSMRVQCGVARVSPTAVAAVGSPRDSSRHHPAAAGWRPAPRDARERRELLGPLAHDLVELGSQSGAMFERVRAGLEALGVSVRDPSSGGAAGPSRRRRSVRSNRGTETPQTDYGDGDEDPSPRVSPGSGGQQQEVELTAEELAFYSI